MARLPRRVLARLASAPFCIAFRTPDGRIELVGGDEPSLEVHVVNDAGMAALRSLSELKIVEAYLRGDLDLRGDLIAAMDLRALLSDIQPLIWLWMVMQPALLGRKRSNPGWIAKHYDLNNVQLFGLDEDFNVYTPGIYTSDEDTLEEGAARKLDYAFRSLSLSPGDSVLDVGCGWGGFLRFCAARGVDATGISLSHHQLEHARERIVREGLEATLLYQDFFSFEPGRQFDGISLMGAIEDLSYYRAVMGRLETWLKPGGRVYLDFASVDRRLGNASFVIKHVWPGAFRMVYLPHFASALVSSKFDIVEMRNDRHNYYLWTKKFCERWTQRKAEVVEAADEVTWRLMRLLSAGTAHIMSPRSARATAYRVVLGPRDHATAWTGGTSRSDDEARPTTP